MVVLVLLHNIFNINRIMSFDGDLIIIRIIDYTLEVGFVVDVKKKKIVFGELGCCPLSNFPRGTFNK